MTDSTVQRARDLARQATQSLKKESDSKFVEAAKLLREATSLASDDPEVKAAWVAYKEEESRSPLPGLCEQWVKTRDESDGDVVLKYVKNQPLSSAHAKEAFEILAAFKGEDDILDEVTGLLLKNPGAQELLANYVMERPTQTYYELFERGDDSIAALLKVLLNRDAWPSKEAFEQGHRDCFMLSLAMMMETGLDFPERAMKGVANLLAAHAEHLKGIVDADSFDVILKSLDIRVSTDLRSHATLATVKLMELAPDTAQQLITNFVTSRVQKSTADRLVQAFSAAAAIFPITVSAAATLFLSEGFVSTLVPLVQSKKSNKLEQAALELLNAACVDKACREAIQRHCTDWLEELVSTCTDKHRANLAAVILVKLGQEQQDVATAASTSATPQINTPNKISQEDLVDRFKNMVLAPEIQNKRDSMEGLAFASLRPQVRESLANDPDFLRALMTIMKTASNSTTTTQVLFGGLTILVNLTTYPPLQSEEEKRMAQLKAYANTQKPSDPDPLLAEPKVTARCKHVLDAGTVPLLVSVGKKTASPGILTSIVRVLSSLSTGKPHRGLLAQQGAPKLLLQIWDHISELPDPKTFPQDALTRHTAAQALSRILISINPAHVFGSTLAVTSAIRPLVSLLSRPTDDAEGIQQNLWQLHAFEALLALTNLASLPPPDPQNAIVREAFDIVNDDLLLSQNEMLRRAAAELVCNLMPVPLCLARFLDPADGQAKRRLQVLLAVSDSEDLGTRSAAGGALATLVGLDEGVDAVLKQARGVELLLGLCGDDDADVAFRGVVCVRSMLGVEDKALGRRAREELLRKGGRETLQGVVRSCRRQDVLGVSVEALKILVQGLE